MAKKTNAANGSAAKKKSASTQKKKTDTAAKNGRQKDYTDEQLTARRQKAAIILMAAAVFFGCVAFISGESAWLALHNFMFGVFGTSVYILPLMLAYVAVTFAMDRPIGSIAANLIGIGVFILLVSSAIHIFSNSAEYLSTEKLGVQIKSAWSDFDLLPNAGVIGALAGGVLSKLAGKTGAAIINVLMIVVAVMLLTGMTLAGLGRSIYRPMKKVGELTDDRMAKNAENAKLREEKKALWIEKKSAQREEKAARKAALLPHDLSTPKTSDAMQPPQRKSTKPAFVPELPTDKAADDGVKIGFSDMPRTKPEPKEADPAPEPTVFAKTPAEETATPQEKDDAPIDDIISRINSEQETNSAAVQDKPDVVPESVSGEPEEELSTAKPYRKPPIDCLTAPVQTNDDNYADELKTNAKTLLDTLESFNVHAKITEISRGPSVTRYELLPNAGVRINKITTLSDDIALRLAAPAVRIEAPIPNKAAVGIEVPNRLRSMVYLREIIDTPQFKNANSKLNVALGKDIAGNVICADLAKMPHLLIAGTTGSGKSVCINTMIISILYNATPDEVKLLMIDPKQVEFTVYNGIAHLAVPVVSDPKKASGALSWAVNEMENRYKLLAEKNVRDITGYNKLAQRDPDIKPLHHIVIFIDELADLMMVAPNEVEDSICRLAQKARAAGMHLVVATQRPSVNVITGIIKANIPSRIALSVSSQVDSRTILDFSGAEKLLGNGDMLFNPLGILKPVRVQGCFISSEEVENITNFVKSQAESEYDEEIMTEIERQAEMAGSKGGANAASSDSGESGDEMFPAAVEIVLDAKMASTTLLQRKLKLGYARAARLMDELEEKGIIGPFEGSKPRQVLITKQQWMEKCAMAQGVPKE